MFKSFILSKEEMPTFPFADAHCRQKFPQQNTQKSDQFLQENGASPCYSTIKLLLYQIILYRDEIPFILNKIIRNG